MILEGPIVLSRETNEQGDPVDYGSLLDEMLWRAGVQLPRSLGNQVPEGDGVVLAFVLRRHDGEAGRGTRVTCTMMGAPMQKRLVITTEGIEAVCEFCSHTAELRGPSGELYCVECGTGRNDLVGL